MIQESRYWKKDLLRFAAKLGRIRKATRWSSAAAYVAIEKTVMLGAFVVRRLAESKKLSDSTPAMLLRVSRIPSSGTRVTWMNNHRLDELFDWTKSVRQGRSLGSLCNQAIHSHIFAIYRGPSGKRIAGVLVASDWERNRALLAVPLFELERAFRKAGHDYPSCQTFTFERSLATTG